MLKSHLTTQWPTQKNDQKESVMCLAFIKCSLFLLLLVPLNLIWLTVIVTQTCGKSQRQGRDLIKMICAGISHSRLNLTCWCTVCKHISSSSFGFFLMEWSLQFANISQRGFKHCWEVKHHVQFNRAERVNKWINEL